MSKRTPPKLNLQIRSASFKENGHAGTAIQNKSSTKMQLLKTQWQSDNKNTTESVEANVKTSVNDLTSDKFSNNSEGAERKTACLAEVAIQNHVNHRHKESPAVKSETVGNKLLNSNFSVSDTLHSTSNSHKNEDKIVAIESIHGSSANKTEVNADANKELRMKTDVANAISVAGPRVSGSSLPNSVTNSLRPDEEKPTNSLSGEITQESAEAKKMNMSTVGTESWRKSSQITYNASQNRKENNENILDNNKVPYDNSTTSSLKQPSPNLSKTCLIKNDSYKIKDVVESQTLVETESKGYIPVNKSHTKLDGGIGNISRNNSSTKLKLPEKRKLNDDPETLIEELQEYLRERFGSVVNETYTQVGEPEAQNNYQSNHETGGATCLNFSSETDSNKTSQTSTPVSTPTNTSLDRRSEAFIPHPIFFKTSVKKDPGSKLHDALVNELNSVLKKRDDPNSSSKETDKNESPENDKSKFPRRRISAKGNKVLGNKALIAHLEDHLSRTLHKNKIFQRQSLKVLGLDTIEIKQENKTVEQNLQSPVANDSGGVIPPAPVPPPIPHYGAVPLHIIPKDKGSKVNDKSVENHTESIEKKELKLDDNKTVSKSDVIAGGNKIVSKSNGNSGDKENVCKNSYSANEETGEKLCPIAKDDELIIYTYEHPSGRTEGVVCSVETEENPDSSGKHRKYITCVNIVAEKSGINLSHFHFPIFTAIFSTFMAVLLLARM